MTPTTDDLARLPMFIGLSEDDLKNALLLARMTLQRIKKGSVIVEEYSLCAAPVFVLNGKVEVDTYSDSRSYHVVERLEAPFMIEPDRLYGLSTHYRSTYYAATACDTLSMPKEDFMMLITKYDIVRFNFFNAICRKAQQADNLLWLGNKGSLKEGMINFFRRHCITPTGYKTFYIKMVQMADELNVKRLYVSQALNDLDKDEKIILKRGIIEIPELRLLSALSNRSMEDIKEETITQHDDK